ncbi:MAG TPA: hypothetical protein VNI78_04720 [Vicinamibacterales bacterium]|nr:hypothetical protein [Vicinamibacterales bacterium]
MSAGQLPLEILQGETLVKPMTWYDEAGQPVDLTGYTARMQARERHGSPTVLLELTTENGGIQLGGPSGTITLSMSAAQTAALTWRRGVYDLELVSPAGVVTRLIEGVITVVPEVTQ